MQHVKQIKELIEDGDHQGALSAIDDLLELGPNNINAMKLKAHIFHQQGLFKDEEKIWQAIIDRDNEDLDAIEYLYNRHIEEREHYYFTDDLPKGRRYLANPRKMVHMSLMLLVGCMVFLMASNYSRQYLFLTHSSLSMALFGLFVLLPLLGVLSAWSRTLRDITISHQGIRFNSLFRSVRFNWEEVEAIFLAHEFHTHSEAYLHLIIKAKNPDLPLVSLNLSKDTSSIRARTYFINDINNLFGPISYSTHMEFEFRKMKKIEF